MDFKQTVLNLASLHNISQAEIARRAGMTPSNLQRVLKNPTAAKFSSLLRVANAAGLQFQLVLNGPGLSALR